MEHEHETGGVGSGAGNDAGASRHLLPVVHMFAQHNPTAPANCLQAFLHYVYNGAGARQRPAKGGTLSGHALAAAPACGQTCHPPSVQVAKPALGTSAAHPCPTC